MTDLIRWFLGQHQPQQGHILLRWWANTKQGLQRDTDIEKAGGRLNKKDSLTRYGDSHVKDKTS